MTQAKPTMTTRRCFIGSLAASAGAAAFAGKTLGGPDLKVGVLSDIHLSQPEKHKSQDAIDMFRHVLEFFRKERVDAVLIAGKDEKVRKVEFRDFEAFRIK